MGPRAFALILACEFGSGCSLVREQRAQGERREELRAIANELRGLAAARAKASPAAIRAAHEKRAPLGEKPCAVTVAAPPAFDGKKAKSFDSANAAIAAAVGGQAFLQQMKVVTESQLASFTSPSAETLEREAASLDGRLSDGSADDVKQARGLASRFAWDLVLVREQYDLPIVDTKAGTFKRGRLAGRAYLYDFKANAVVCAADVDATNSPEIEYALGRDMPGVTLSRDLESRALATAAKSLRAVDAAAVP